MQTFTRRAADELTGLRRRV